MQCGKRQKYYFGRKKVRITQKRTEKENLIEKMSVSIMIMIYHDQFISWDVSRTPSLTSVWVIINIFVSFNVNLLILNALWMFINVWSDSRSSTLTSLLHFLPSSRLLINENILHINQCKYFPSFSWQLKFHSKTLQSSVG